MTQGTAPRKSVSRRPPRGIKPAPPSGYVPAKEASWPIPALTFYALESQRRVPRASGMCPPQDPPSRPPPKAIAFPMLACSCSADMEQHTTQTSFGGRCFESSVLVRRRMNWFTILPSSADLVSPFSRSLSVASGSRPRRIGRWYSRQKSRSLHDTGG
eukprot:scaffold17242_cov126-Isochrysis_galbana.AAC.3